MEFDLKNSLTTYFGNYGLIFFVKHNEYYKASLPNIDTIKNIYDKMYLVISCLSTIPKVSYTICPYH